MIASAVDYRSPLSVNWQEPVNPLCAWNRGLVLWLLNVPHWQGGLTWNPLVGPLGTLTNMETNDWSKGTQHPGGFGLTFTDGVNESIVVVDDGTLNLTGAMSAALWFRRVAVIGAFDTLFGKSKSGSKQYAVDVSSAKVRWGDELGNVTGTTSIALSTWYHLVVTYDGSGGFSGLKIYLNGLPEATSNVGTFDGFESGTGDFYIGSKAGASEFSSMTFDDCRLWNRCLAPPEAVAMHRDSIDYNRLALTRWTRGGARRSNFLPPGLIPSGIAA